MAEQSLVGSGPNRCPGLAPDTPVWHASVPAARKGASAAPQVEGGTEDGQYGEEALAGREAALWLHAGSLTLEHEGRALSRYDVERAAGTNRLSSVARPRLFRTPYAAAQPRLFGLDEAGWLKALRLGEYAARDPAGSAVFSPWRALEMPAATFATVRRSAARGCP